MKRMKMQRILRTCICAGMLTWGVGISHIFAQGVGINTSTPDPSAALDIKASDKGILIPQVQLQSLIDQFTIPAPAHGLMVYHMGNNLGGKGFFYNSGLANGPIWKRVGELTYPYYHGGAEDVLFNLENYKQNATTIRTYSTSGNALEVAGGLKIAGPGQSPGLGKVLTSDAQGNAKWEGAVAFRASGIKLGGSEKIAKIIETKIPFANEDYDISSSFNDINGNPHSTFIAPIKGIYHFEAYLNWASISSIDENELIATTLTLFRSGSMNNYVATKRQVLPNSSLQSIDLCADVFLEAGDQVYCSFAHYADDYLLLESGGSRFTGRLVLKL